MTINVKLYTPIQPIEGNLVPAKRLKITMPSKNIPKPAESTCPSCTFADIGAEPIIASSRAIIRILNIQLPRISPTVIFGRSKMVTELMPVINSGREVTEAIRITPIQVLPSPVFSAIMSLLVGSYRDPKLRTERSRAWSRTALRFTLHLTTNSWTHHLNGAVFLAVFDFENV